MDEMIEGAPARDTAPPPNEGGYAAKPEPHPSRKANVEAWSARIKAAKQHWDKRFKRMRMNQKLARQGATDEWKKAGNYTVPVAARHINQKVARLYARNPQARAKVRERMMYQIWDENGATLQRAQTSAQQGIPPTSEDLMILQEMVEVGAQRLMLERTGKTLEILFNYFVWEQTPSFKSQFKQMVRRTCVNGVGYVDMGFQRILEPRPEPAARLEDDTSTLTTLETLAGEMQEGKFDENDARADQIATLTVQVQDQQDVIVREGLVFDFPRSTEIVVDTAVRQLKGFIGANWIGREFHLDCTEIKELWNVDIGKGFTPYDGKRIREGEPSALDQACVWEVRNKKTGQVFVLADGYCDFIKEPAAPDVKTEGFWNRYVLSFNDVEDEDDPFPPSDMEYMEDAQDEMNRSRQALRMHRIAARPGHVTPRGALSEVDKKNLQSRPDHAVIEVTTLQPGQDVKTLLQAIPTNPIDPNLYETGPMKEDILMATGSQEANLGPTSDSTATESSIAEDSRQTTSSSDVDEVDELLTQMARDGAQILLLNMSPEMVKKIVGPGAVWPTLTRQDIVEEITLEIKAGSSGRPNKAAELAAMERAMPFILQLPGINPTPLAEQYLDLLGIDWKAAITEGLPSITAMNAMMTKQAGTPAPDNAPQNQGGEGGQNDEKQPEQAPPGQPAYPADGAGPDVNQNALQPM